jgi:hypothetical protein
MEKLEGKRIEHILPCDKYEYSKILSKFNLLPKKQEQHIVATSTPFGNLSISNLLISINSFTLVDLFLLILLFKEIRL